MQIDQRPATLADAHDLGPRLRKADQLEVKSASGMDACKVLVEAVTGATQADAWSCQGKVLAISGLSRCKWSPRTGVIWMLGCEEMEKFPKEMMRGRRQYVKELLKGHDMLLNFVDNRNTAAQRWLKWLGFSIGEPQPFGVAGLPFRPFWLSAHGDLVCPSPGHDAQNRAEVCHV